MADVGLLENRWCYVTQHSNSFHAAVSKNTVEKLGQSLVGQSPNHVCNFELNNELPKRERKKNKSAVRNAEVIVRIYCSASIRWQSNQKIRKDLSNKWS